MLHILRTSKHKMRALHLRAVFRKHLASSGLNFNSNSMEQGWHKRYSDHVACWETEESCFEFRHDREMFIRSVQNGSGSSHQIQYDLPSDFFLGDEAARV
jgi:hypothetical protein